ncbi:MAG: hypothetical protein ACPGN3_09735 [Opitutales bacterium]
MKPFSIPLYNIKPIRLNAEETDAFARRVGWIDDAVPISADTTIVERMPLTWWDDVDLIIARDLTWSNGLVAGAWMLDEHLHRLDGTSPPIHAMNAKNPPQLTPTSVLSYLGFFCAFVHGDEGPFAIVETSMDLAVHGAKKEIVDEFARPSKFLQADENGYHCEALVFYERSLFLANFLVKSNGMAEMLNDEPLVADTGGRVNFSLKVTEESAKDDD